MRPDFKSLHSELDRTFGEGWADVPLREWEYVAAALSAGVLEEKPFDPRALDAGSGLSIVAPYLAHAGWRVDSLDLENKTAREDRNRRFGVADRICEHDMSLLDLDFPTDTFDVVFCVSAIEHVNAGKFALPGLPADTGDTRAMKELARVLKPRGVLVITTDYAERYFPPPGLWPSGSHRIYSWDAILDRLIRPVEALGIELVGEVDHRFDWSAVEEAEPKGFAYTAILLTLTKRATTG